MTANEKQSRARRITVNKETPVRDAPSRAHLNRVMYLCDILVIETQCLSKADYERAGGMFSGRQLVHGEIIVSCVISRSEFFSGEGNLISCLCCDLFSWRNICAVLIYNILRARLWNYNDIKCNRLIAVKKFCNWQLLHNRELTSITSGFFRRSKNIPIPRREKY